MGIKPSRRIWFHGTQTDFYAFSDEYGFRTLDLNTRFGLHFASNLATAWNFGTWLYRKADEAKEGFVLACSLDLQNPYRFEDEKHLADYVRSFGVKAGILPSDILIDAAVERWIKTEAVKWQGNEKYATVHLISYYASEYWPALSKAVEKLGVGQTLVQAVVADLQDRGFDGLIYGNTSEKEVSRYREMTAVCFATKQIEVLGKVAVGVNDEFLPSFAGLEKSNGVWRKKVELVESQVSVETTELA